MGTPTLPADPATIVERADRLYEFAVSVTGCATPWIAENELFGAQTPTPWTATTAQYRENTLILLRRLRERGAVPAITIANPPYTGGEAADWWRELARTALLIRQVFFTAPNVPQLHALGPVRGSRAMRKGMRGLVRRFTEIGIPASRVALELQFHSAPGQGGREGLQPRSKWLEVVKLEALAARQVTAELGTHSIWSWGWATFSQAGIDKDKGEAVCVYLWVRDPRLCSGPGAAGPSFDASLTAGQIDLPAGVVCETPAGDIRRRDVAPLVRALGDADLARTLVLERLLLRQEIALDARLSLAAEAAAVEERYGGSEGAYLAALRRGRLTRAAARALLTDEVRRDAVRARFRIPAPRATAVAAFRSTYGALQARLVEASRPVGWLGGGSRGFALESLAPSRVFTLVGTGRVRSLHGRIAVRPLEPALPLAALPPALARPVIDGALRRFARVEAYENWLLKRERAVLLDTTCLGDDLPEPAVLGLDDLLP